MLRIPLALLLLIGSLVNGGDLANAGVLGLMAFLLPVAMLLFSIFIYLYAGSLFP